VVPIAPAQAQVPTMISSQRRQGRASSAQLHKLLVISSLHITLLDDPRSLATIHANHTRFEQADSRHHVAFSVCLHHQRHDFEHKCAQMYIKHNAEDVCNYLHIELKPENLSYASKLLVYTADKQCAAILMTSNVLVMMHSHLHFEGRGE
jgi:hypothetical protein